MGLAAAVCELDGRYASVTERNLGAQQLANSTIESVITKRSAEEMKLKVGDKVLAVIKSTEVILQKD